MNKNQMIAEIADDVKRAARITAREWADVIDADDAEQEIWLRLLDSSKSYLSQVHELEKETRQALLVKIGHQVGMKYRDDYELFSGNHRYGTYQVRDLLEAGVLDRVADESLAVWELPESVVRQIERTDNETLTEMIDLFEGLKDLARRNPKYAALISAVYRDGDQEILTSATERKNLTRAVDALTVSMNNYHRRKVAEYEEGIGTRKAISNEKARFISQRQYSGRGNGYNAFAQ